MSTMWQAVNANNNVPANNAMRKPAAAGGGGGARGRKFGNDLTANQNNALQQNLAGKKASTTVASSTPPTTQQPLAVAMRPAVSVDDIDSSDLVDPQCVADYAHEIHQHFRHVEQLHMPPANYMDSQKQINVKMRAILIDWLVEVHLKFKLMPETLYLTVNLIDRYLALQPCGRRKLQLVGVTCMLVASKYEEIYFPEVRDFVYITDKAYSREEILQMEGVVLNTLKFDLTVATPLVFLKRFLKAAKAKEHVSNLAHFFTERMLQEYHMLGYTSSVIAASAVSMALRVSHCAPWSPTLAHYANYTEDDLKSCIGKMTYTILNSPTHTLQAVRKKYSSQKFSKASLASFEAFAALAEAC